MASCLQQTYRDLEVLVVLDGGATRRWRRSSRASTTRGCGSSVTRPTAGSPRPTTRSSARRAGSSSPCSATTTAACPIASPVRSPSSTAIPTRASSTAPPRSSTRAGGPARRLASRDFAAAELLRHLVREHNTLVDPSRMVHRRVYEAVGGYDPGLHARPGLPLLAARRPRLPLPPRAGAAADRLRRHGENFSDESLRASRSQQVERAAGDSSIASAALLVPELDWAHPAPDAAGAARWRCWPTPSTRRALPLPRLARRLRARAAPRARRAAHRAATGASC